MARYKAVRLDEWRYMVTKTIGRLWWTKRFQRIAIVPEGCRDVLDGHLTEVAIRVVWEDDPEEKVFYNCYSSYSAISKVCPPIDRRKPESSPWIEVKKQKLPRAYLTSGKRQGIGG